jgi:hypothetical protein
MPSHLRPAGLSALLDAAVTPSIRKETVILSVPARLRRAGMEIRMLIDGTDPFAAVKPDARLIKLLVRAHRFNTTLVQSDGLARTREGTSSPANARAAKRRIPAHDLAYQPILGLRLGSSGLAGQGAGDAPVLKNNQRKSNSRG